MRRFILVLERRGGKDFQRILHKLLVKDLLTDIAVFCNIYSRNPQLWQPDNCGRIDLEEKLVAGPRYFTGNLHRLGHEIQNLGIYRRTTARNEPQLRNVSSFIIDDEHWRYAAPN